MHDYNEMIQSCAK